MEEVDTVAREVMMLMVLSPEDMVVVDTEVADMEVIKLPVWWANLRGLG